MTILWVNCILLFWNLFCAGYLLSKTLYRWGCFVRLTAPIIGGYNKVAMLTFVYCKQRLTVGLSERRAWTVKPPTWSIMDGLLELTFLYDNNLCKLLFKVAKPCPTKVTCEDGLDVTTDVVPYLSVIPIRFTPELYGEDQLLQT